MGRSIRAVGDAVDRRHGGAGELSRAIGTSAVIGQVDRHVDMQHRIGGARRPVGWCRDRVTATVLDGGDDGLPALQVSQPGTGRADGQEPTFDECGQGTGHRELAAAKQRDDLVDAADAVDQGEQAPLLAGAGGVKGRRRGQAEHGVGRGNLRREGRPDLHPALAFGDQFLRPQTQREAVGVVLVDVEAERAGGQRSSSQTASVA